MFGYPRLPLDDLHNLDEMGEKYFVGHGCGSGRTPGEHGLGFAIAIFMASCAKEKKNHY